MATNEERAQRTSASSTRSERPAEEKTPGPMERGLLSQTTQASDPEGQTAPTAENDVFGNEEDAEIHYKTCKW